jgi:dTDP-4-dehydrorhamnose reductase
MIGTGGRRPVRPGNWRDTQLDIRSPTALRNLLERERPQAVFFCVHDKEDRLATVDAAGRAAGAAEHIGAKFVFFSTDRVFDGRTGNYDEAAPISPVVPYGAMKADAEALVRSELRTAIIVRTSLLVGESGVVMRPAFECDTLLRGQPVPLYRDEWRSPTHVDDLAKGAWDLVRRELSGVIHLAGPDRLSRLELGRLLCGLFRFDTALLRDAARPADRPRDTSLDSRRATELLGWAPRSFLRPAPRESASLAYA